MARISVLISIYNVESYVADALRSIQRQTIRDIEVIVVDDGSTDNTRVIVEELAAEDSRIKVIGTARNMGTSRAMNLGLKFCSAAFIAKMDGDDIALPERLEKQLLFLDRHPEIALVGCAASAIDSLGRPIPGLGISRRPLSPDAVTNTIMLSTPCTHLWLARREVYDELAGYREMMAAADYDFLLRAHAAGFQLANIPDVLMQVRTRPGNASSRLEQRKAHYYLVRLYRERLHHGQDSFTLENYRQAVKPGALENKAFQLSTRCLRAGLQAHSLAPRYILLALSALLSPWQARYFLDRVRLRFALRAAKQRRAHGVADGPSEMDSRKSALKICFIIHNVTARAGSERAQANLANALVSRGESISIWSMYGARNPPGFSLAKEVSVSYGRRQPLPFFLDYPWLACAFAMFIFRLRPQWIICTGTNRLVVALPAILTPGVKVAIWEQFPVSTHVTRPRGRLTRVIASVVASRIVTLTEKDKDLYAALYTPAGAITRIPNIVVSPGPSGAVRRKEVLAMGRLVHEKGFDLLLAAWSVAVNRLPDWSLRIAGDGKMRDQLAVLAHNFGIESSVTFSPFSADPFSLYSECGIFVLSSRFEGLPSVLIEAMTCGAACISFDCPNGPREVIRHEVNGLLIPAERVDALADAIVALGLNSALRQKLGDAARSVAKEFSEPHIARQWHEVLYGQFESARKPVTSVAAESNAQSRAV